LNKSSVILVCAVLAGCQGYHREPLPDAPDFGAPGKTSVPAGPLSLTAVAGLAVSNNPDLVASRAKADVASAQAFAAGLLPDPQFTGSVDYPSDPGTVSAYALGLSEDLQQLLTFPSRQTQAEAARDQARLSLLWDEWQTIEMAGTLGVQKFYGDAKARQLGQSAALLQDQAAHSDQALAAGNATIDAAGGDLAVALDAASQSNQAERAALTADIGLKKLLNVAPGDTLLLSDPGDPGNFSKQDLNTALANITKTRPDLLALQAGYKAQEEAVRQSILEQFPAITFGYNRAADTTPIHTTGLSVAVNLPLFNGARGNIRIQHATRDQLHAEYQARLDQTTDDAWRLWQEIQLLRGELSSLQEKLPEFRHMAEVGLEAHANGDLPPATFVVIETSLQARESEFYDVETALWSDTLALHTLLGMPFSPPPTEPPSDKP
jgi:outer membrane protein TolC